MVKKFISCLVGLFITITCTSCKTTSFIQTNEFLSTLSYKSGLVDETNKEEYLNILINYGVIDEEDVNRINEDLNYDLLSKSLCRLLDEEDNYLNSLKERKWIRNNVNLKDFVDKDLANELIDKTIKLINNKQFENKYTQTYKSTVKDLDEYRIDNDGFYTKEDLNVGDVIYIESINEYIKITGKTNSGYLYKEASFEDVIEELDIEGSYEIDFSEAVDIPGGVLEDEDTLYINNGKELLAASKKTNVFNTDGFRVSYAFKRSGIDARISKNINGINVFFDISLSNIKPSYKWDYKDGTVNEAYFKVDYKATTELGASIGKYKRYYLDLKDKDPSSFLNSIKSIIKEKDDEVEATIKICEIKTPIPDVPTAYFNIDVLAKIYVSGKVEVVLYNDNSTGFEVKNGTLRLINENEKDIDVSIGGSSKACLGLNFNLEATKYRLIDLEIDAGVRASISSTLHLYDEEGNMNSVSSDYSYSTLDELAKENDDVKVCGDVSLNWLLDIYANTSKALLHKFGLWTKKSILDSDNQIFLNNTHIENGVFVKTCTRKNKFKTTNSTSQKIDVNKIILDKYSVVINVGETYSIPIEALPSGYTKSDLLYESLDSGVVSITKDNKCHGIMPGAAEIKIYTSDKKYSVSVNILVSTG